MCADCCPRVRHLPPTALQREPETTMLTAATLTSWGAEGASNVDRHCTLANEVGRIHPDQRRRPGQPGDPSGALAEHHGGAVAGGRQCDRYRDFRDPRRRNPPRRAGCGGLIHPGRIGMSDVGFVVCRSGQHPAEFRFGVLLRLCQRRRIGGVGGGLVLDPGIRRWDRRSLGRLERISQ